MRQCGHHSDRNILVRGFFSQSLRNTGHWRMFHRWLQEYVWLQNDPKYNWAATDNADGSNHERFLVSAFNVMCINSSNIITTCICISSRRQDQLHLLNQTLHTHKSSFWACSIADSVYFDRYDFCELMLCVHATLLLTSLSRGLECAAGDYARSLRWNHWVILNCLLHWRQWPVESLFALHLSPHW